MPVGLGGSSLAQCPEEMPALSGISFSLGSGNQFRHDRRFGGGDGALLLSPKPLH